MKLQIEACQRQDPVPPDGMLFVRTSSILTTMVQAPLIVMGLIVVVMTVPIQNSFSSTRTLDLTIYPDGSTHVFSEIEVDPLEPDFIVDLFGTTIDNFVAEDENGFLLSGNIQDNKAIVETFGSSTISVDYDTHDLVSKEGRIWTFTIDVPVDYTLLMPRNTVIVGMTTYPLSLQVIDEQSQLFLPSGAAEINYFFVGVPMPPGSGTSNLQPEFDDNSIIILVGGAIAAAFGIIAAVFVKRAKSMGTATTATTTATKQAIKIQQEAEVQGEKPLDKETIFRLRPGLREDDKQFVAFIYDNGGQALESELRKKFLQPRTTMWRAVKRLERQGIVEIEKKDMQNLVKLKKKLEDEP